MNKQLRSALYGALVGDALGVPYEFHYFDIPTLDEIEMTPPANFRRSHAMVPPGTYSDDGALMLALAESLYIVPTLDTHDFATRMLAFMQTGMYAVDNVLFDIGFQTRQGLQAFANGAPPTAAGPNAEENNGNGSLMRVLPVAFLPVSNALTVEIAMRQSLPTHGHPRSQIACAMYALIAKGLIKGKEFNQARDDAGAYMLETFLHKWEEEISLFLDDERKDGEGTGYVVDTYWSAIDVIEETETYEECVQYAIALGNDTDTTACVAGGLAGLIYGYDAIPQRWLDALRGKLFIESVIDRFESIL